MTIKPILAIYHGNSNQPIALNGQWVLLLGVMLLWHPNIFAKDCTTEGTKGEAVACLQDKIEALDAYPGRIHVQRVVDSEPAAIDNKELLRLCGDEDGCNITIGYRYVETNPKGSTSSSAPTTSIPAIRWGPDCRFHIDTSSNTWSIPNYCHATYKVYREKKDESFQTYDSGAYGVDGDGSWFIVLGYFAYNSRVCVLAEDKPGGSDSTTGFFFYMKKWDQQDLYFYNPKRTCELLISD